MRASRPSRTILALRWSSPQPGRNAGLGSFDIYSSPRRRLSPLRKSARAAVIFTNPPFVLGALLLAIRSLMHFSLWADCHSGAFNDPRWSRFARGNAAILKRCDGVIFHNSAQASEIPRALSPAHRRVGLAHHRPPIIIGGIRGRCVRYTI